MNELTKEQLELVNHPIVQSLLYDLNLLPEQLLALDHGPGHKDWGYMLSVIGHFKMMMGTAEAARLDAVMVPREPTEEILIAMHAAWCKHNHGDPYDKELLDIYRAMITAAAPRQQSAEKEGK